MSRGDRSPGLLAQARGGVLPWSSLIGVWAAVVFGAFILFGTGLAQSEVLHNAAHDARHAAGFPCH